MHNEHNSVLRVILSAALLACVCICFGMCTCTFCCKFVGLGQHTLRVKTVHFGCVSIGTFAQLIHWCFCFGPKAPPLSNRLSLFNSHGPVWWTMYGGNASDYHQGHVKSGWSVSHMTLHVNVIPIAHRLREREREFLTQDFKELNGQKMNDTYSSGGFWWHCWSPKHDRTRRQIDQEDLQDCSLSTL